MIPAFVNNKDFRWLACVYMIKNEKTGFSYIGQTCWLQLRLRTHRGELRGNKHYNHNLQSDYNVYGEKSFSVSVLHVTKSEKKRLVFENCTLEDLMEQKLIDPHFSENKNFHSPIARFEPTEKGWENAVKFTTDNV